MAGFTHLHVHTEYSMLDGASPIKKLVQRAVSMGMTSAAITDHGNMFGIVKFYNECKSAGIKPILGCELYVAPRRMFNKEHPHDKKYYHATLLAKDQEGYNNLMYMSSEAYLKGFYYKPRVDRELMAERSKGLICLSGCLAGEVPAALLKGDYEKAREAAIWYQQTFGEGNFYLELMNHGMADQLKIIPEMMQLSRELGIPLVATNDSHYIEKEDAIIQDIMICIEQGATLNDESRMKFEELEYYFKSEEQMRALFPQCPDAIDATAEIAERCNVKLDIGNIYLPDFDVPEGYTPDTYLRELTYKGLAEKYPKVLEGHQQRADFELDVIQKMGFSAYFLIVWDLLRFARSLGIPVGPGRGSVAGSIIAFALDITKIDPIKYDLLFERFLNPDRISMPDIDMDFCYERRGEVIEYARQKYGEDKVAMIITFGREKAKNSIRDVGRVMGMPLPDVDRVAKLVPFIIPDEAVTLENSLKHVEELRLMYENDPQVKKLIDISMKIEGTARNISTHAAGIVISKRSLVEHVPLCKTTKEESTITQFVHGDLEMLGLMKMDFLGLRTLTVMDYAVKHIKRRTGEDIDIDGIPLNDAKTYSLFKRADTNGIFQFEGNTMKGLLQKSQPTCLEDLIALNALNRPGPLGGGMVDDFIKNRKSKKGEVDYFHPDLEPTLRDTFGIILYQEQVMRIANIIGGFSLSQADSLRRAMGKKKKEEIDKQEEEFIKGAIKGGYTKALAEKMFGLIQKFAGYGFNKSHSAAYGFLAYQTGYLKANYPREFMAALMTSIMGDSTKVSKYIEDCRAMKIEVGQPDVNVGYAIFTPVGDKISFGISAVKNVGANAIDAIIREREENGPYKSIFDLCARIDLKVVNSKTLEALIRSGACDCLPGNRAQKMAVVDEAIDLGRRSQKDRDSGQISLFGGEDFSATTADPVLPNVEEFDSSKILADEKELLGLYLTLHPLDPYREWIRSKATCAIADLPNLETKQYKDVCVAGRIERIKEFTIQTGDLMAFVDLEDFTGRISCTFNAKERLRYVDEIKVDNVVAVRGRLYLKQSQGDDDEVHSEARLACNELENLHGTANAPKIAPLRIMHVRINASLFKNPAQMVEELKNLLQINRGPSKVILHVEEDGSLKKFQLKGFPVKVSKELVHLARRVFGDDNVWVETKKAV